MAERVHRDAPARWPTWLIIVVGLITTVVALVWAGATYDTHGKPLLDDAIAQVLVAMIGATATVSAAFGARVLAKIRHQVENSHGTVLRDDIDRINASVEAHRTATERVSDELRELRVMLVRLIDTDHQTHDDLAQLRREFAQHTTWSQAYTEQQDVRLRRLEEES